ncbi:MAG: hypothetical protein ACFCU8_09410 [Thermosynechococcaceae cyanobacterium]
MEPKPIMDERDQELERLRQEKMILLGLMAGGYAYFIRQFMVGHHAPEGLTPEQCEQTIIDALKRVQSTQERFGYEYLSEIAAALARMSQAQPIDPYLQKISDHS